MKKIFTLAATAMIALAANAQIEEGWANVDLVTDKDAGTVLAAGTELAASDNVKWTNAGEQTFKDIALAGENDPANQVTIGNGIFDMPHGLQAQGGNGKSLGADCKKYPGIQGSEHKFTVTADGILYIFHKGTATKNYYVYEGALPDNTGFPVAYTMVSNPVDASGAYTYTLPADDQGFGWADYKNTDYWSYDATTETYTGTVNTPATMPESTWTTGNALCVFAFPVYADAGEYYVWAQGSKITINGFVFAKGASTIESIAFSKATAVQGIAEAKAEAKAPVKVITANGVQIGNYNVAGQQVK